jgi:hypothetical protein
VFILSKHPRYAASLESRRQTGVAAATAHLRTVVATKEEAFHEWEHGQIAGHRRCQRI